MSCIRLASLLILLLISQAGWSQQSHTINGYVREAGSQETFMGANVRVEGQKPATITNGYGYYSLTIDQPAGQDSLTVVASMAGYRTRRLTVSSTTKTRVDLLLEPTQLEEIQVSGSAERLSNQPLMSRLELTAQQVKALPAIAGEKDVLKVMQLMPGVQKGTEGSAGIYVRGGGADQNLIVLDEAVVYNVNHLFGFFSVFNNDALKNVRLTKGGFPARYGGRLSSVVDVTMKEGNRQAFHGEGGIGLLASRLTLEGPLRAGKGSFIVSGRRTYVDLLLSPLLNKASNGNAKLGYYFYDLNAKLNYDLTPRDKLYVSGYFGQDRFNAQLRSGDYASRAGFDWGNATTTLRWNHLFNQKTFANLSLIFSRYRFDVRATNTNESPQLPQPTRIQLVNTSAITDYSLKYDIDYYPNQAHAIRVGVLTTFHRFKPSAIVAEDSETGESQHQVQQIDAVQTGVYAEDTWTLSTRWQTNVGLRVSQYATQGARYLRPEPRLTLNYKIGPSSSLKASYAIMNQYLHLLSNTGAGLPTDLWVPTTSRVAPQQSEQVAIGYARDLPGRSSLVLSVEGYYKQMSRILSYREGASFLSLAQGPDVTANADWQDNVTAGRGWSYGSEWLLQKRSGSLTGWVGYTLSWTRWQFPELNSGQSFFPRQDRRHDVSVVGIYRLSKKTTLSATWVFATGNHLTIGQERYNAPVHLINSYENLGIVPAVQQFGNITNVSSYGERNAFQTASYHRLDVAVQFTKRRQKFDRIWDIGLYNTYNRKNPFYYSIDQKKRDDGKSVQVLRMVSLFPILPYVSYNFKF